MLIDQINSKFTALTNVHVVTNYFSSLDISEN
jgi:hypothetical protein